jgi:hypothetical protein
MNSGRKWTHKVLVGLLAMGLMGVPPSAVARDRCDNQRYSDSYGYRDNAYRNNRNDSYYASRYRDSNGSTYRNDRYYRDDYYYEERSPGKSAAIIGGSAAAGAVVGGLTGGKKGAIIGGAVGGVGGLIYDRATKDRGRYY